MPGELLCDECRASLPWVNQRWACPVCGAPYGWLTCTCCEEEWEARTTICALSFGRTASQMVACLKDRSELRLAGVNAAAMATALDEASAYPAKDGEPRFSVNAIDAVCFVPATAAAYVRRGFDHMELVSRELCGELDLPLADVLVRARGVDQRKLGREERSSNLVGTMEVAEDISGLRLLLLDDVVTTGASLREATRTLLDRGAQNVTCCALTRVW